MMKNKKILASVAAVMLLATGTFAWQSFSQLATNEIIQSIDTPGGRLHDYFNGSDKNVFVENYATGDNAPNVYARIRLSEYFEYGKDAGTTDAVSSNITLVRGDIQNVTTPLLGNTDTWDVYDYAATLEENSGDIRDYRSLDLGGTSVFMPTFNQDNTDLDPDVRGTYRDVDGNVKADPYDDYASYEVGDEEEGTLVTSPDDTGITKSHTAKATGDAIIMTMSDWVDAGAPIGDYWVFDTTGWAYYAQAITPGEASGLLLDGISVEDNPNQEWYYAVDVKAQLATAGDWGEKESSDGANDGTGMYEDLTGDALGLLNKISGIMQITNMEMTDGAGNPLNASTLQVSFEDTLPLAISIDVANGTGSDSEKSVEWTVTEIENIETVARTTGNGSGLSQEALNATVSITEDGIEFIPEEDMAGYYYDITATSTLASADSVSIRVFVYDPTSAIEVSTVGDVSDLKAGNSLQVNAYYAGGNVTAPVEWSVTETSGDSGLDTAGLKATISDEGVFAPVASMAGGTYEVTATTTVIPTLSDSLEVKVYTISNDDTEDNGTAKVTVTSEDNVSILNLYLGEYTLQMYTHVDGLINTAYTWGIEELGTSIGADLSDVVNTETGLLIVTDDMMGGTYRVSATSDVDVNLFGYMDIVVRGGEVIVSSPGDVSTMTLSSTQYELAMSASITGFTNQDVTWEIKEQGTSIGADLMGVINTTTGLITATDAMAGGTYRITATSEDDNNISGYKDISIATPTIEIVVKDDAPSVQAGKSFTFTANIIGLRSTEATWTRSGNTNGSTTIDSATGILSINSSETAGGIITISALASSYSSLSDSTTIIVDSTDAQIIAAEGKGTAVMVGGVEFYVLDVGNKDTYASTSGGTATMRYSAFLLAKEPWKSTAYKFNTSRNDSYDNSTWGGSELQANLDKQINENSVLSAHALRVNTTVASSSTTYDLFFPLSIDEIEGYNLEGTSIAKDSAGSINSKTARWTRTRQSASYVRIIDGNDGYSNEKYDSATDSRGVRPAFFYDLGTADSTAASITVSSASDVSKMTLSSSDYTLQMSADVKGLIGTVAWTVTENSGDSGMTAAQLNATISTGGLFTAVDAMTGGSYTIKATSTVSSTVSSSKTISISQASIGVETGTGRLDRAGTETYTAIVTGLRSTSVSWSRTGNSSASTTISSGKLTIASAETVGNDITVTVQSSSKSSVSESFNIEVTLPYTSATEAELKALIGTEKKVTLDGIAFYILAQDDVFKGTATGAYDSYVSGLLLWSVDAWAGKNYTYSSASKSDWVTSDLRSDLKSEVSSYNTINSVSIYADTSVHSYAAGETVQTYDKIFPLSYDEFNNYNLSGDNRAKMDATGVSSYYWLRSGSSSSVTRNIVASTGKVHSSGSSSSSRAVRTALWIEMGPAEALITIPGATQPAEVWAGSESIITLGGVKFYVLDAQNIPTYNSSGVSQGTKTAALLWAVEPWNNGTVYKFSDAWSSTWATSQLRTTLETELTKNSTLLSKALYVDTSVYSYDTEAIYTTYDRFFPLSYNEFNTYNLSGTTRAMDTLGPVGATGGNDEDVLYYRWLRDAMSSTTTVHYQHALTGKTTGVYSAEHPGNSRGVRPAMWVAL